MKRVLWLGIGLAVGALAVRAVSKRARSLRPGGLAAAARDSAGGLVGSVRSFVEDVREGMAEREDQIHAAFADGVALDDDDLALDVDDYEFEEGKHRR
jgi:hypothetical protein